MIREPARENTNPERYSGASWRLAMAEIEQMNVRTVASSAIDPYLPKVQRGYDEDHALTRSTKLGIFEALTVYRHSVQCTVQLTVDIVRDETTIYCERQ